MSFDATTTPPDGSNGCYVRRLIESAVRQIRDIDMGRHVERRRLRSSSGLVAAAGVAAALLFTFGPARMRELDDLRRYQDPEEIARRDRAPCRRRS